MALDEAAPRADHLVAKVDVSDTAAELSLCGELDMATGDDLSEIINRLRRAGRRHIVLDVEALEFCDVAGLTSILVARRRLLAEQGSLTVRGASPVLDRLLVLAGTDAVLDGRRQVQRSR